MGGSANGAVDRLMGQVLIEPQQFKALLYNILTNAVDDQAPDISMRQQMGIQLSSAVLKEKGVLNIQLQSVAIKNVMVNVTEALKMIDSAEPLQIEAEVETPMANDLEIIIDDALFSNISLDDFLDKMTSRYVEAAIKRHKTLKEAETALGLTYQRFLKIRKKHDLGE